MRGAPFAVSTLHIALLRHAYVGWNAVEYGAPSINPKRPYGNGDVLADLKGIARKVSPTWNWDDPENERLLEHLHSDLEVVLQIVLATGSFEPGEYVKVDRCNCRSWTRVGGER